MGTAPVLGKGHGFLLSCNKCESEFISGGDSKFCIDCASKITSKTAIMVERMESSRLLDVTCKSCKSKMYTDIESSEKCFCPICANEMEIEDPEASDKESKLESEEQPEEEVKEEKKTVDDSEDIKQLIQGSYLPNSENWVFFKKNEPFFRIEKNKVSKDLQPIFANNHFFNLVTTRIEEVGLSNTLREFNASVYNIENIADSIDIESYAFEKFQSSILPKFIDCLHLAIKGSTNVFTDLNASIRSTLVADLVGSGLPTEEVSTAVTNSITSSGPELFGNFIVKALELYKKDTSAFTELKSIVATASPYTQEDFSRKELRNTLVGGNLNLNLGNKGILGTSVQELKSKLNFSRR